MPSTSLHLALALVLAGMLADSCPAASAPTNAYFYFDAEAVADGAEAPQPPFFAQPWQPSDQPHPNRGRVWRDPTAPQGSKIFRWDVTAAGVKDRYHEVRFDRTPPAGGTFYCAFFVRFDRKEGRDIWHDAGDSPEADSFDKAFEVIGDGIRWVVHFGNHDIRMRDHYFSAYLSNASYHLNPELEEYDGFYQNYEDFSRPHSSRYHSIPLEYETWHAVVFKLTWATNRSGAVALWLNGKKALEYTGIRTVKAPGTFERLQMWGTFAQPAYDAPPHVRKVDAMLFTDDWQDIVKGGYLGSLGDQQPTGAEPALPAQPRLARAADQSDQPAPDLADEPHRLRTRVHPDVAARHAVGRRDGCTRHSGRRVSGRGVHQPAAILPAPEALAVNLITTL